MQNIQRILILFISLYPFAALLLRQIINVRPNFFLSIIALVLFIIIVFENKRKVLPNYLKYYGIFVLYTIFGDLISGKYYNIEFLTFSANIPHFLSYVATNPYIFSFVLIFIIENTKITPKLFFQIKINLYLVILVSTIVIIIQVYSPTFLLSDKIYSQSIFLDDPRRYSLFGWIEINEAGFSFPAIISILLSLAFLARKNKQILFLILTGFIFSFLTQSRFVLLSIFIIYLQYIYYSNSSRMVGVVKYIFLGISIIGISVLLMLLFKLPVVDMLYYRIFELNKGGFEHTTASTRVFAFQLFQTFFPLNPFFGTGGIMSTELIAMKSYKTSQIHVGWLSLLYYYGIVGGGIFIFFMISLLKHLHETAKKFNYWGSLFAFLTFFISINLTAVAFEIYYTGFVLAIVFNNYIKQNYGLSSKVNAY